MGAVLPYFKLGSIPLGPIDIQAFGILVAIGVLLGANLGRRVGDRWGLDPDVVQSEIAWCVITGFVVSHIWDVVWYQPENITDFWTVVNVFAGISSVGGFIGATLGFFICMRKWEKRGRVRTKMEYADLAALSILPGWIFGRMGCTVVHDHPGRAAGDFFLAIDFHNHPGIPDGPRHDLGFYELLFTIFLCGLMYFLYRKPRRRGFFIGWTAALYGPVRFGLDFLRDAPDLAATDKTYLGLTSAHYISALIFFAGVGTLIWAYKQPFSEAETLAAWQAGPPPLEGEAVEPPPKPKPKVPKKRKKKK